MNNKTINMKILYITLGIIFAGLWIYLYATIPNMLVSDMSKLEKLGVMWMIVMPFISAGLLITGFVINDASLGNPVAGDKNG